MIFLRQSTASQEVLLGPFLDDTDGKTAETALSIANTDIKIWKRGATTEASKNSGGATHIASGRYYATLDSTDTDTVGELLINVHVSGALPVRLVCCVLEEAVFDDLFASSAAGYLKPTTAGRTLDVSSGGEAGIDWANVGSPTTTLALTGTTIATTQKVDVETIKTQAVTCSAGVTVSPYVGSTGAAINGTNANTLSSHDPGTTIGTSTLTQAQVTGGSYALNSASFAFNAALDFTTTQKAATLARVTLTDTLTTYTGNTPQTGDAFARIGATGSGLTSLAPAATALSTATWTTARAGYLDNISAGAVMLASSYSAPLDAAGTRSAVGLAAANLDTQLAAIVADTNELQTDLADGGRLDLLVDAILDDTGTSGVVVATGSKSGYALSSTGLDLVLVDGKTLPAALRIIGAVVAGKVSGAGTSTEVFVGLDGSTTRATVTADADGNRTAVSYA